MRLGHSRKVLIEYEKLCKLLAESMLIRVVVAELTMTMTEKLDSAIKA
jgi:hypothetical protein